MLKVLREEAKLHRGTVNAIEENNPEKLGRLLSKVSTKKMNSQSRAKVLSYCLDLAIFHKHVECIRKLLKAGANRRADGKYRSLGHAIWCAGDVKILTLLLEHGIDYNVESIFYAEHDKPLLIAAESGYLGCFRTLLLYGAEPNYNCSKQESLQNLSDSKSLLGFCLENGLDSRYVKLLIDFGANMYLPDVQEVLHTTDNEASALLLRERAQPRSLMSQCRLMIRKLLRQNGKLNMIDQLEIPNELLRYLQYHKEMSEPENIPPYVPKAQPDP